MEPNGVITKLDGCSIINMGIHEPLKKKNNNKELRDETLEIERITVPDETQIFSRNHFCKLQEM